MKRTLLSAALSAGLMALSGAAFAQSNTAPANPPGPAGAPGAAMPNKAPGPAGGPGGSMASKPANPPQSVIGEDVANANGDTFGSVDSIQGDQVIVSTGGFLGLGARNVAIPWSQLAPVGSGDNAKLKTSMTQDQINALPDYHGSGANDHGNNGNNPNGSSNGG